MYDVIIKGGTIVDGLGGKPFVGDIAFRDGKISEIGASITATAKETLDAEGKIVTPGWVDVHTHYDGQVSWDTELAPSSHNGATTVVMGNCGVGLDRKSTRLNSSHDQISYAVFCLKKQKKL